MLAVAGPVPFGTPFTVLCALTLASLVIGPFAAAAAPSSGMRNAAGVAPLVELLEAGVNVALGTDNVTNNNSYDIVEEANVRQEGLYVL